MADPCDLPPHLVKLAADEIGETPEQRCEALAQLQSRIAELPEEERLADARDENLIRFLRSRKYNIDEALKSTVKLQKFHTAHPEWCQGLKAREFKAQEDFFQVLEQRGPKGEYIVCLRPNLSIKKITPEYIKANPLSMIRSHIWMLDVLSRTVDVQVAGLILCVSFKGFTFHDNLMLSKGIKVSEQIGMVKYVSIMGFRLTGAFIFDQPSVFSWLWSVIRMFVSETIRSRMNMCGSNYDRIKAVLADTSILPICMGGTVEDGAYVWEDEQIAKEEAAAKGARRSGGHRDASHD